MRGTTVELWKLLRIRSLSATELQDLVQKRLSSVMRHAYVNVPYYGSLWRSAGVRPEDVRSVDDLPRLPLTTKAMLKAAGPGELMTRGVDPSACYVERTSGASGNYWEVFLSPREAKTRRLVRLRAYLTAGRRPRDVLCVLGLDWGAPPNIYDRLGLYRTRYVSAVLPLEQQVKLLREARPDLLRVWPSAFRSVLHEVDYGLSKLARPRAIYSSSEVLDDALRRRILADLDVEFFNFYVAAEAGEIASDCPAHEGLHVNADQVIVEVLRDDGQVAEPGEPGVVVVTSLHSYTMPIIRYRLGDISTRLERPCSCGLPFPLIGAPLGRQEDAVRLPSGRLRAAIGLGLLVDKVDGIDQFRIIQERPDHIVLQLVWWREPTEHAVSELRTRMLEYLGEPVQLDVERVDSIPEEKRKFRKFISELNESTAAAPDVGHSAR